MVGQLGGAPPDEKAAARSANRSNGPRCERKTIPSKYTRPRPRATAGEMVVYDGRTMTGWLQPRDGRSLAFAADGRSLGSHTSDKLGARAIFKAAWPGDGAA